MKGDASAISRRMLCGLALLSSACGEFNAIESTDWAESGEEDVGEVASALTTAAEHSLVIYDVSVVEDPARTAEPCLAVATDPDNKEWSLPYLLKKEAARYGIAATTYVANWLNAWNTSSNVNGQSVPVKGAPEIISYWPKNASGQYRLEKAPFRLSAIVSRLDLRTFRPENEPIGGEVRFVYTAVPSGGSCPPTPLEQAIILEYSAGRTDENDVLAWAKRWYDLGNKSRTSAEYRTALQQLTDETLQRGKLERIRTNEVAPNETTSPGWFFMEFVPGAGGSLVRATVKQTPQHSLRPNGNANLANFIASNMTNLQTVFEVPQKGYMYNAGSGYRVPDKFPDNSTFRGAFANASKLVETPWNAPKPANVDAWSWSLARHRFSLGTCNGCHGGEDDGGGFPFHIFPRSAGLPATLSTFLSGPTTLIDPFDSTTRSYNEMKRRQDDLHWLANELPLGNPVYGNYYKMRLQHSSKCIDMEFESTTSGSLVKQYPCHGRGNQRLAWIDRGNNEFSIRFKHSGLCLDVENGSLANGAKVVQKPCSSAVNSQRFTWFATSGTNSPLILTFKHSSKCLRVQNQSTNDAAQLIQDTCSYVPERGLFLVE